MSNDLEVPEGVANPNLQDRVHQYSPEFILLTQWLKALDQQLIANNLAVGKILDGLMSIPTLINSINALTQAVDQESVLEKQIVDQNTEIVSQNAQIIELLTKLSSDPVIGIKVNPGTPTQHKE